MKTCPVCGASLEDNDLFCVQCGASQSAAGSAEPPKAESEPTFAPPPPPPPPQGYAAPNKPPYDPYDHTAEYDKKDISDNKVIAMAPYLLGWIGIIVALLAAKDSPYVAFHMRQALKMTVISTLLGIIALVLVITIIVPIAAGVCIIIVFVLQVIAFFQVCGGKAKEPAIIRSLGFLR